MTLLRPLSLRPSAAKRWMACRASPGLVATLRLAPTDSPWADEGTKAHEHAAKALLTGWNDDAFDGDIEMAHYVKGYYELVRSHADEPGRLLMVEQPLPLFYDPDAEPGTTDAAIIQEDGTAVFIDDLKYGAGVSIAAEGNVQLAIYALSVVEAYKDVYDFTDDTVVTLSIYQPRIADEPALRQWVLTLRQLREFCAPVGATVQSIKAEPFNQPFSPSDSTCQFCPAQAVCAERARFLLGELPLNDPEDLLEGKTPEEFPAPEELTLEQVANIVRAKKSLVKWLNDCEEFGTTLLASGKEFPGFKLVAGRSIRKWSDEEVAAKFLRGMFRRHQIFEEKLVSPTQAEKMMKQKGNCRPSSWKKFEEIVSKPGGGPTLAPLDDPRPALNEQADPKQEFQSEEGSDLL